MAAAVVVVVMVVVVAPVGVLYAVWRGMDQVPRTISSYVQNSHQGFRAGMAHKLLQNIRT